MDKFLAKVVEHFGLKADLQPLGGELDLNFISQDAQGPIIVKIMRKGCSIDFVEMQIAALNHALKNDPDLPLPEIIAAPMEWDDNQENSRIIWLQRALQGKPMGDIAPQSLKFLRELGNMAGRLNKALAGFDHSQLMRENKWQLLKSDWIETGFDKIKSPQRHQLLQEILIKYQQILPALKTLPHQAIHNDLNDWNILIKQNLNQPPLLSGLIDFGDMCRAPVICDLAIAGAYAIMRQSDKSQALAALVQGFHAIYPLSEQELEFFWPLVRMRLAVSVVNAAIESEKSPGELYVTISERGAWDILEDKTIDEKRLLARLRHACGLPITSSSSLINQWIEENHGQFAPILDDDLCHSPIADLSVENCLWPENPLEPTPLKNLKEVGIESNSAVGRYGEPRLGFQSFINEDDLTSFDRPTIRLGLDIFDCADSLIHAPLAGIVTHQAQTDHGLEVILRHDTPVGHFFSRWAHLNSIENTLAIGTQIKKGEAFAKIANTQDNGGWLPNILIQMSFVDLPGSSWSDVAQERSKDFYQALFPNPARLLKLNSDKVAFISQSQQELLTYRQNHFAANLKLSYKEPVMFVRGWRHHLFDIWGRPFLDAYNNVPHVGHAHPRIRRLACAQLGRMNSNTRYLHPAQRAFAEKLISKMPENSGLEVCFFVNSGSEANELALRLSRAATGGYDMITPDHGYHGNTTGAIDISAYKFNKPGMGGRKEWVHLVDVADDYRGTYRADNPHCASLYAAQIDTALTTIKARGGKLAGFICETFPSVGGQIIPPFGYLAQVYKRIRAAGGICIADEVQTGLGRLGDYYFAFEQQQVVPDIVVLGKPIGNGHPLAAVITTSTIAEKFAQGAEYFSTFGGSTLSCLTGKEVLDIVDDEELQHNARNMGARLLDQLRQIQTRHPAIGEVRGMGLFIGVDLVEDRVSRKPATALAEHVTNRLREAHILVGREGPADNILKIRPPLTVDAAAIDRICSTLDKILQEVV